MLPFLDAKTQIPILSPHQISRPHLYRLLDQCLQPGIQLALVSASAGAGKTTLLAEWLQEVPSNWRFCWLSLDVEDNHLTRFFSYLTEAIKRSIPGFMGGFTTLIEANQIFTPEQIVTHLIEQLIDVDNDLLIVLDDYHTILDSEIHQAVRLLIDHLPFNVRLVISGRVEPPLPLARLRARGQLVEVHTDDLRFSHQETTLFLNQYPELIDLMNEEKNIHQLNSSTEGWAAGLQMVALALCRETSRHNRNSSRVIENFIQALGGTHRFIFEYLLDEVLSQETDRIRKFLLHTCLLKRFNADQCVAIMPEISLPEAREMLMYLERANLFIIALDDKQVWYRYHHLFSDMLEKQLLHNFPDLSPIIHQRAASWLDQQGIIDEAIEHALATGDNNMVLDLLEKHTLETILQGKIASATGWMEKIPHEVLMTRSRLCLDKAWALSFSTQTEAAIPFLEQAAVLSRQKPAIQAEILGLKSYGKSVYGLTQEAVHLAQQALELSPADDSFLQCVNHLFLASALVRDGKLDQAMQTYRTIRSTCRSLHQFASLALIEVDFLQYAAALMNASNQGKAAKDLLTKAIQDFETNNRNLIAATLHLWVGLGKIYYIENQLVEAERVLEKGLRLDPLSLSLASVDGWLTLWWVKIGQGDYPAARRILIDLEPTIRFRDEKINRLFTITGALQDLLEGNLQSAVHQMELLGFTEDAGAALEMVSDSELIGWRSNEFLVFARVLAAQGKIEPSLQVLERMEKVTNKHGLHWIRYRTWITQALIYYQSEQIELAMGIMGRLLNQTSQMDSDATRIYLSAGEPVQALLKEAVQRGIQSEYVAHLLKQFPPEPTIHPSSNLIENLSEREMEVLHLMAEGLRNQEIGQKLFISLNTIRYHTKNIFGKLEVSNRTAAVARARDLGIM